MGRPIGKGNRLRKSIIEEIKSLGFRLKSGYVVERLKRKTRRKS
jgi:hypothetical protein